MTAADFQMQPLDLSCPERKVQDLSSRRRRASTSPPPLERINPGIHSRIRIRADLTNSRDTNLGNNPYYIRRGTGNYEGDHDSSVSITDTPTDLRRIVRDEFSRPVGNPRKRFLSKYLHNDLSVEDVNIDEGVENDRPMHPGKGPNVKSFICNIHNYRNTSTT